MATVTKDFKVKNGLIVEGTTATVNNHDILTKKTDDQNYIIGLIGGSSDSANTPNTVVKRDGSGDFAAGTITADLVGDVTGNADTATALETARTISLAGDVTGSVSFDGTANVSITATIDGSFATDAEVATAKSEAIADAATDATTKANAALSSAQSYADQAETDAIAAAGSYTDGREAAITTAYQAYADTAESDAISTASADATSKAATAESNANSYTDSLIGDVTVDGTAGNTVTDRIATAVSNLVDSAPATLDTLNELAAALQDNPDVIGDLQSVAAGKQNTLTAGSNIDITNDVISVTGLVAADISDFDAQAVTANTGLWDASGSASAAQTAAQSYADGLAVNYDAVGSAAAAQSAAESFATSAANTAEANAIAHADALTTDDVAEGVNDLYYTTVRAKTDAASLLTGATLTNIQITGDENGLTITAENGVADSTTDDLTEGSSNLYFTDARAVSALEAVTPDFPAVEIASVAKQVATKATVATASTSTALSWAKADYRSGEFIVKIASGTHTEVSKIVLTLDTSDNVAITEYAMVGTNGSLGSVSADVSGDDVRVRVTTDNNNSDVTVVGTILK